MRVIGYCNNLVDSCQEQSAFPSSVGSFSDQYNHQINSIVQDEVAPIGASPNFRSLMDLLEKDSAGYLIVIPDARHIGSDLESVARNVISVEKTNSSFYCLNDDYPDVLQNALLHINAPGVSVSKSNNIKDGMQSRAMSGKSLGKPPFGYLTNESGEFTITDPEAVVVRQIFEMYVNQDMGLRKVVQFLNDSNIRTRRGKSWNIVTVRDILKNSSYIGTYQRFGLRLTRNHDPIIKTDLFRAAQDKVRERRKYKGFPTLEPYLLSSLCQCGYCGNTMMGVTRKQNWKRQGGERVRNTYRYYQCQSKGNQGTCGYHTWITDKLEARVLKMLTTMVKNGKLQKSVSGPKGEMKLRLAAENRFTKVVSAEKRFVEFMKKTARGESVVGRLELYLKALDNTREQAFISCSPEEVAALIESWEKQSFTRQQAFLNEYISLITVKDRSVKISL